MGGQSGLLPPRMSHRGCHTPVPGAAIHCHPTGQTCLSPAPFLSCHQPQPPPCTVHSTVPPAPRPSQHLLHSPLPTSSSLPRLQELTQSLPQPPTAPGPPARQLSCLWTGGSTQATCHVQPRTAMPRTRPRQGDWSASPSMSPSAWHPSACSAQPRHYATVRSRRSSLVHPCICPFPRQRFSDFRGRQRGVEQQRGPDPVELRQCQFAVLCRLWVREGSAGRRLEVTPELPWHRCWALHWLLWL